MTETTEIDVEVRETSNSLLPEVYTQSEVTSLREELATAILGRLQETESLQLRFMQSGLTHKEKLDALINFKACMVVPSLKQALGLPADSNEIEGTFSVLRVLESLESSIRSIITYEDNENIDFSHPKIVESFRMLFEIFVEVLNEEVKDQIIINNFIEKSATRCVNIEQEFNKLFRRLSNKMASLAKNPITQPFEKRNTDPVIQKKHLIEQLIRTKNATLLEIDTISTIDTLIEKLQNEIDNQQ